MDSCWKAWPHFEHPQARPTRAPPRPRTSTGLCIHAHSTTAMQTRNTRSSCSSQEVLNPRGGPCKQSGPQPGQEHGAGQQVASRPTRSTALAQTILLAHCPWTPAFDRRRRRGAARSLPGTTEMSAMYAANVRALGQAAIAASTTQALRLGRTPHERPLHSANTPPNGRPLRTRPPEPPTPMARQNITRRSCVKPRWMGPAAAPPG